MAKAAATARSDGRRVPSGRAPRSTALAMARARRRKSGPWPWAHGPIASRRPSTAPLRSEVALFDMSQLCHSSTMLSETIPQSPAFGRVFTGHMVRASFHSSRGWDTPEVVPFADLALSPAAMVFHYGQAVFEGLKAFRQPDGGVALFRVADHAARFNRSAIRLAMPPMPADAFVNACVALVSADADQVPSAHGSSLYLRPMMIASEIGLGVRAAEEYLFLVIAAPVGSYFDDGVHPIALWASADYVRAAPGGTGFAKCGGNYGGSLAAKQEPSPTATTRHSGSMPSSTGGSRRWAG